jgi:multiple sugar transport system substrate-binding protein
MSRCRAFASVIACLALVLTACGGVGGDDNNQASGGKAQVTTMGFGLPDEHATARVDAFKEANPDIEVRINEGGFDEQQFLSAVASGEPPDVLYVDRNRLGSLAARGAVEPIDDCVSSQSVDLGQYREQAVRQVQLDGKTYGLPDFHMVRLLVINNPAVREAGLQPQDISTTDWSKLATITNQLTKRDGSKLTRIGFDPKIPDFLPMWAKANGGELISEDGKTPKLDSPEVLEAAQATLQLVEQQGGWAGFKAFRDSWDFHGANNQYVTGQLAAMPIEAWYINTLAANSPNVDITVAPFTDRQGNPLTYSSGQAWAIPKGSKNRDAACKFIVTMTKTDSWVRAAQARRDALAKTNKPYSGTYTGNKEADERIFDEVYTAKDNKIIDAGVQVALEVQDDAYALPGSPAGTEVVKAYEGAINRALNGQQPIAEALKQAQQEATEAINRAGS